MNEYMIESYFDNISDEVEISVYEHLGGELEDLIDDNFYIEGANLDARAYFKQYKKEFKVLSKKLKNEVKSGNYNEAKQTLKECDEKLTEGITKVQDIDYDDIGSFIGSLALGFLPDIGRAIALSLIPCVGKYVASAYKCYQIFISIANSIKRTRDKGEDLTLANFNVYKNLIIEKLKEYKRSLKKYYAVLGNAEQGKTEPNKKAVNLKLKKSE